MTIDARLADGRVLRFPDGTPDDVIDRTVREQMGVSRPPAQAAPPASGAQEVATPPAGGAAAPQGQPGTAPAAPVQASTEAASGAAQAPSGPGGAPIPVAQAPAPQVDEMGFLESLQSPQLQQQFPLASALGTMAAITVQNPRIAFQALDDAVRATAAGMSFGLADEFAAAANTLFGTGDADTFSGNLALEEARDAAIDPTTRLAFGAAGGVATTGGLLRQFPHLASTPLRTVLLGTAEGGIAGFGGTQGSFDRRFAGGVAGAGAGGLLAYLGPLATQKALDVAGGLTRAQREALSIVRSALSRGDTTFDEATAEAFKIAGPGSMRIDSPVMRGLAKAVTGTETQGNRMIRDALNKRFEVSRQALQAQVARIFRSTGGDFDIVRQGLVSARERVSRRLYDEARAVPPLSRTKDLRTLLGTRSRRGSKVVADAVKQIRDIDPDLRDVPDTDMRILDRVYKRVGEMAFAPGAAKNEIKGIRRRLLDAIGEQNPTYRVAVETFSDSRSLEEALDLGRRTLTARDAVTSAEVRSMTAGERDQFLVGVTRGLIDKIEQGGPGTDIARRLLNPVLIRRLRAAIQDDKALSEFVQALTHHAEQAITRRVVTTGSPTAPLLAEQQILQQQLPRTERAVRALREGRGVVAAGTEALSSARPRPQISTDASRELAALLLAPPQGLGARGDFSRSVLERALLNELTAGAAVPGAAVSTGVPAGIFGSDPLRRR